MKNDGSGTSAIINLAERLEHAALAAIQAHGKIRALEDRAKEQSQTNQEYLEQFKIDLEATIMRLDALYELSPSRQKARSRIETLYLYSLAFGFSVLGSLTGLVIYEALKTLG